MSQARPHSPETRSSVGAIAAILRSGLPPHLKLTAAVLAVHGNADELGSVCNIWPSMATVARLCGCSRRQAIRNVLDLLRLGVMHRASAGNRTSARQRTKEYVIVCDLLPRPEEAQDLRRHLAGGRRWAARVRAWRKNPPGPCFRLVPAPAAVLRSIPDRGQILPAIRNAMGFRLAIVRPRAAA